VDVRAPLSSFPPPPTSWLSGLRCFLIWPNQKVTRFESCPGQELPLVGRNCISLMCYAASTTFKMLTWDILPALALYLLPHPKVLSEVNPLLGTVIYCIIFHFRCTEYIYKYTDFQNAANKASFKGIVSRETCIN
jgi:hypothetical protein